MIRKDRSHIHIEAYVSGEELILHVVSSPETTTKEKPVLLRISRADRFDNLPDMIIAAARNIGAPRMMDPEGVHLELLNVSHGQLQDYDRELRRVASEDPSFGRRSEVGQLVEGLNRCSRLILVSTTHEVLLVSDEQDSKWQYEYLEGLQIPALRPYDEFKTACMEIVAGLSHLPA